MKVGITLDGVLCDTEALKEEWFRLTGDWTFLNDAAFWVALKPYDDVREALGLLTEADLYVFVERPKSLFLPTRAWLRNNCGVQLTKERLLVPALKRYDCRMNGIDAYIDTDPTVIENLKIETVQPVATYLCDRRQASLVETVRKVLEDRSV